MSLLRSLRVSNSSMRCDKREVKAQGAGQPIRCTSGLRIFGGRRLVQRLRPLRCIFTGQSPHSVQFAGCQLITLRSLIPLLALRLSK